MNNFDPLMMQRMQRMISENPELARLISKPGVMQKMQAIASNPNNPTLAMTYASDPDIQKLMSLMRGSNLTNPTNSNSNSNTNTNTNYDQKANVIHINSDEQFYDILRKTKKLAVCDFYATWCGPCKVIAPEFERFSRFYQAQAIFLKIDVDKNSVLARKLKITAMPTFQFYKNETLVDEFSGASVQKLEQMINRHSNSKGNENKQSEDSLNRTSPYQNLPLNVNNLPFYPRAPFAKMLSKFEQLNDKFLSQMQSQSQSQLDIDKNKYCLTATEKKRLKEIIKLLQNLQQNTNIHNSSTASFSQEHNSLITQKLLLWPSECLPIVLDLIKVWVTHPNTADFLGATANFDVIKNILEIGGNGLENPVNGMLTCKIVTNLFARRKISMLPEKQLHFVVNKLLTCMQVKRKNTRLAFVRVLICFSYNLYSGAIKDQNVIGDKILLLSILVQCLTHEIQHFDFNEAKVILNILMAIGTVIYADKHVCHYAQNVLELELLLKQIKHQNKPNPQICLICDEILQEMHLLLRLNY